MSSQKLKEQINLLVKKPGHEKVRHILSNILKEQLDAKDDEIAFEEKLTCRGRIDALWGRNIFEVKRDLKKELSDAKSQIKRYIQSKEEESKIKYVGIATDGQQYKAYFLHNNELKLINEFVLNKDKASEFIQWLESMILIKSQLSATPEIICKEIGQGSPLCQNALVQIEKLWHQAKLRSDVRLKYDLWKKSIDIVYGKEGADDKLFIEHTYLTIISKAIAHIAFDFDQLPLGKYLLNGKLFEEANVFGVVEKDFFSWITFCGAGNDLIRQVAKHVQRFDFSTIEADILKGLYEGLIRQEQRHKMGEYYTPDWLAEKICKEVIKKPLEKRIIDPACGSGTFLFHSIRLLIQSAEKEKMSTKQTINLICEKIFGIDIHPVAVIFSRITYLLAMLNQIRKDRPDKVQIPIYLGDSLQWGRDEVFRELRINVPEDKMSEAKRRQLVFPESICRDSKKFETILREMIKLAGNYKETFHFEAWIKNQSVNEKEYKQLLKTYKNLLELQRENRNHIWGYVARNLTRPIYLSSEKQKADIVIGNPPWLKFNSMNAEMQKKLKEECFSINLWEKKNENSKLRTSQDISTYFFVRSVELYMKEKGEIAFVMPYGVMNGDHHAIFRKGTFIRGVNDSIHIQFKNAWVFDSQVKNLFKIPSCVLFSVKRKKETVTVPKNILYFKGALPQKNSDLQQANKTLSQEKKDWPKMIEDKSYYFEKFKQGASLVPRRFLFVEKIQKGKLGSSSSTPLIKGITSNLDKAPWKHTKPLEEKIESQFLKSVYTGQSIAPFRVLDKNTAIIPYTKQAGVMDAKEATREGWTYLSSYLEKVEKLWDEKGTQKMTFKQRINYQKLLEKQFIFDSEDKLLLMDKPSKKLRVVYTAAGTHAVAVLLEGEEGVIDTKLYWTSVSSKNEGLYLEGILNSTSLIKRIRGLQSQGLWGPRDISRHLLKPYFSKYNSKDQLHKNIVECSKKIKQIAETVDLDPNWRFIKARQKIRERIQKEKSWKDLNLLVNELLDKKNKTDQVS